jgi:hypothetical protein
VVTSDIALRPTLDWLAGSAARFRHGPLRNRPLPEGGSALMPWAGEAISVMDGWVRGPERHRQGRGGVAVNGPTKESGPLPRGACPLFAPAGRPVRRINRLPPKSPV